MTAVAAVVAVIDGGAVATGFVGVALEDDDGGSADDEHPTTSGIAMAIAAPKRT